MFVDHRTMHSTLLFLAFVFCVHQLLACSPQTVDTDPENDGIKSRKRRSVEDVTVTLVTNRKYDERTKKANQNRVRKILDKFQEKEGFFIDYSEIKETIKEEAGNFAIEYQTQEECEQVMNFVRGAKSTSREIAYVLVNCGSQPLQIFFDTENQHPPSDILAWRAARDVDVAFLPASVVAFLAASIVAFLAAFVVAFPLLSLMTTTGREDPGQFHKFG